MYIKKIVSVDRVSAGGVLGCDTLHIRNGHL